MHGPSQTVDIAGRQLENVAVKYGTLRDSTCG